jgi:hypothetical protein
MPATSGPKLRNTWGYLIFMLILTLTFLIIGIINATKYNNILSDENDEAIGLGRGTVIWLEWLNIGLAVISGITFLFFVYRMLTNRNIYADINKKFDGLSENAKSLYERYKDKGYKKCEDEYGIKDRIFCDAIENNSNDWDIVRGYLSTFLNVDEAQIETYITQCQNDNISPKECIITLKKN